MPDKPVILSNDEVAEIEALSAKVPDGPWFADADIADDVPDHRRSGLALVDTGRSGDWWIARLCEWHIANFIAASKTNIDALCATVRALRDEREKAIKLLSPNIPRADLCDAARQIVFAHALEKGNAEKLQARLKEVEGERDRLLRGDFAAEEFQNLCHNTDIQAGFDVFADGCEAYQQKMFGRCRTKGKVL